MVSHLFLTSQELGEGVSAPEPVLGTSYKSPKSLLSSFGEQKERDDQPATGDCPLWISLSLLAQGSLQDTAIQSELGPRIGCWASQRCFQQHPGLEWAQQGKQQAWNVL